jgi:beta-lactamase regulating signal transducer with metallopeptidase domain
MTGTAALGDPAVWLGWLLTYLVHGALWFGVVWAVFRLMRRPPACLVNLAWKLALVAPLLSATWHTAAGGIWRLPALSLEPAAAVETAPVLAPPVARPVAVAAPLFIRIEGRAPIAIVTVDESPPPAPIAATALPAVKPAKAPWSSRDWLEVLFAGLAAVAGARLAWLVGRAFRLRRLLADRCAVTGGPLRRLLDDLQRRAGIGAPVRLTVSARVHSPMALWGHEICLPGALAASADPRRLAPVLAHELAHLERGDNLWLAVAAVLEAVLFVQPLTPAVRRRMEHSAELACDDRAVELTGDAMGLARSLADAAAAALAADPAFRLAAGIGAERSSVVSRVERLLEEGARAADPPPPLARVAVGALLVLALGVLAPGVACRAQTAAAPAAGTLPPPAEPVEPAEPFDLPPAPPAPPAPAAPPAPPAPPAPAAAPAPPMPPIPPMPPLPPVGKLVDGVLKDTLPRALSASREIGPLAMAHARFEQDLERAEAELRKLERDVAAKPAQRAESARRVAAVRRQVDQAKQRLRAAEDRLERDMKRWEKDFERKMEREFEPQMERWGEQFGEAWEKWGERYGEQWERYGKEMEKWGEQFERDQERAQRAAERAGRAPRPPRATPPRPPRTPPLGSPPLPASPPSPPTPPPAVAPPVPPV